MPRRAVKHQTDEIVAQKAATDEDASYGALLAASNQPLLPAPIACFPDRAGAEHAALHRQLADALIEFKQQTERNPLSNPIQLLALDVGRRIETGELSYAAVEQIIQRLTAIAFFARADRLGAYLGEGDPTANAARIKTLIRRFAFTGEDAEDETLAPFTTFKAAVERELFGIVITAHPTFSLGAGLMRIQAELATGCGAGGAPLTADRRRALFEQVIQSEHRPERALDLRTEHDLSVEAIANIHAALRRIYESVFEVAEELYPEDWPTLSPKLLTVASWVGYDLDGRSDIKWSDSLFKRMRLQALQLTHYRDSVRDIRLRFALGDALTDLRHTLELLESRLALAIKEVEDEIHVFQGAQRDNEQDTWPERVRQIAKRMHDGRALRLIESQQLLDLINRAVELSELPATKRALCILRVEIANHGLGMAHTHVRLNAAQLHNAIRKTLDMAVAPDDPSHRRSYVNAVSQLIERVEPVQVNFGSILAEKTSAKRLFMLVAQMLKYVDATTPVRFLIAECETSFTLLTALYYAKLFGVEDKVDISPLFETLKGFERGAGVIEECLKNPHYGAYLRRRGRLCIQTGFSDAGRYLGQIAAAAAVERLRMKLGSLLVEHGFGEVQLVIFDTHGESIGRGAHPSSFADRLSYVASAVSRRQFEEQGVACKEEASFQGGDGYVHFITPSIAFTTVCRILDSALPPAESDDDPFYDDVDYLTEFFITIRQFNERVMGDPNYAALLDAFGTNMLYPAGSRAMRREHDGGARIDLAHPSQLRAIPHNSILQQLGMLANTIGGVGQAVKKDPERFQRLYRESPRFRRLFAMVEWALEFSDLDVLKAYIDILDPGLWLQQAAHQSGVGRTEALRRVSEHLEEVGNHEKLVKIFRILQKDCLDLRAEIAACYDTEPPPEPLVAGIGKDTRHNLHLLHALRIALIQRIFLLATQIPDFSDQHGVTPEELAARILHLDIESAVRLLALIFPKVDSPEDAGDFGEPATYRSDENQSYEQEHARIFQPMARLYELVRRASSGIIHTVGAIG
ncbi:phosphoenolpyruvate carboxylase [Rhodospirillaceae bacterium SYSU D60014]|uniref:phosphoenolpyruvate carboxylase n=1 Tax=Virgifigura deserti TaxID=2268457 RepID=UPI000E672848